MSLSCILLAAGQSKRFGAIKQLARVNETELINATISNYHIPEIDEVLVILGANGDKIAPIITGNVKTCIATNWQLGMGHSLAFGVSQLSHLVTHVLLGLADQPAISSDALRALIRCSAINPEKIVASAFNQVLGAPAIFPASYFGQLAALSGDRGAKMIIQQHIEQVVSVAIPAAQWDIDTQIDLDRWLSKKTNHDIRNITIEDEL
jgi:molybdenum cofactor cytidylyltransferase